MPLFVPVLRILMLFLNVYDSYKTLKTPPPSARNEGRPSVRATTQRKRDMKGCLAVWIVWCSLAMYERLGEGIICLFIPFYDELKSLGLLFLILTRARGAEPIYLHLIRPLIKPYTTTLDGILDLLLMFGDFILALSMYPLKVGIQWWQKRFGRHYESIETEQSTQTDSSNEVNSSEVPTSFLVSSGDQAEEVRTRRAPARDPPTRRSSADKARRDHPPTRRPSADSSRAKSTQARETAGRKEASKRRPSPPSRKQSKVMLPPETPPAVPSVGMEPNLFKPLLEHRREGAEASSHHQIWYPPRSSHTNEDDHVDTVIQASTAPVVPKDQSRETNLAQEQLDDWRQYPPFPSAYPPTPLAANSRLVPTPLAVPSSLYPAIQEDQVQQDFPQSLLPPREPLNPSPAGDLSDNNSLPGISPQHIATDSGSVDEADDSMSTEDDEEDDEFNMTLRTPLPPFGSLRSQIRPLRLAAAVSASSEASIPSRSSALTTADDRSDDDEFSVTLRTPLPPFGSLRSQMRPLRLAAAASASSAASVPSRSSALTTADDGSLRTSTSSDSLASPIKSQTDSLSVIGRKRSYPRTRALNVRNRVREIEERDDDSQEVSEGSPPKVTPNKNRKTSRSHPQLRRKPDTSETADDVAKSSTDSNLEELDKEQIPPEEKRRRVIRSAPRPVKSSGSIRPRARRNATYIPQTEGGTVELSEGLKRRSSRLRSGTSSASASDPPPPVPPKT